MKFVGSEIPFKCATLDSSEISTLVHTKQMSTCTKFKCKECTLRFVLKHNFWTQQKSWNEAKRLFYDPKYTSSVNSVILDSNENTALVHTNQMSTSTNLKCKECTFRFVWKHNFWTRQQSLKLGLEALQDPKCKQCHYRFKWKYNSVSIGYIHLCEF